MARLMAAQRTVVVHRSRFCKATNPKCDRLRYPRFDGRRLGAAVTRRFQLRFKPHGAIFLSLHRVRGKRLVRLAGWGDGGQVADGPGMEEFLFNYPRQRRFRRADTLLVRLVRVPGGPYEGFEVKLR